MQSGKLRHLINIDQPSADVDLAGQDAPSWSPFLEDVWAAIKQISGDVTEERGRTAAQRRYELKIRYATGLASNMRIRAHIDAANVILHIQSFNGDVTDARFMIVLATEELNG